MKFYTLSQSVALTNRTLVGFGRNQAIFSPAEKEIEGFEPLVFTDGDNNPTPLTLGTVSLKKRRIEATAPRRTIKAVEHYSPLRFLFPGMKISGREKELPHFTCAGPLVEGLMRYGSSIEVDVPWFTVRGACGWQYPKQRGGMDAFTMIEPSPAKKLHIAITVRFKGFGEMSKRFVFPDEKLLLEVLSVESLGTPSWLEWPAKMLWVHARKTYWPKKDDENILETIIAHRVQDILGVVALIESPVPGAFPSLNVYSECSGHLGDLRALEKITTVSLP